MGKKAKRLEFLRPKITRELPKILVQRTQILKDICLNGRGPTEQCREFAARLREFLENELKEKNGLNEFCRIASFMVWNSGSEHFERELVYNIPKNSNYDQRWTDTVFDCVFPKTGAEPLNFFYYDEAVSQGEHRPIRELGSELIFAGRFPHRPTIIIDLAFNSREIGHSSLATTPNTFEIDLSFEEDRTVIDAIFKFKHAHYKPGESALSVKQKNKLKNEIQDFLTSLHTNHFSEWKKKFATRKLNRIVKKGSIAESVVALVEANNYSLLDLFYTKIINMILFPDARHLYFIPADILQSSPTGGFFFVTTKKVDDLDILRWNQYALMIFGIVAAIPRLEETLERAAFAHRHLGLIDIIEFEMKRISPDRKNLPPVSAGLTAIRASFFPDLDKPYNEMAKFGKQLTENVPDIPIEEQFDEYTVLASHLALWRILRSDVREDVRLKHHVESFLERSDGIALFKEYVALAVPPLALLEENEATIRRQNYGIMLIQILDQALRHAYLSRYFQVEGAGTTGVSIELERTANNLKLITTVKNPSSAAETPLNVIPKDTREFKRLSKYLRIEDCFGPVPSEDQRTWSTGFATYIWHEDPPSAATKADG